MTGGTGHTPGPWTTEDRCDGGYIRESKPWDETGGIKRRKAVALVRVMNRPPQENEANARLIAAAPDLLVSAQIARNQVALLGGPDDRVNNDVLALLDAAIAKATAARATGEASHG